jgi:hypothetical protein
MLDCEHKAGSLVRLYLLAVYILQVLHHIVGAALLDLPARVARAHRNDYGAGGDAGPDAARRVFEYDAALGAVAEALGRKEERVRRRLARTKAWVVRRDRDFGRDDAHSRKTSMC